MAGIALAAMIFDGYMTTSTEFRDYLWLAAADIFGTIVGISLAIAAFAIVIWAYEKSLPLPENSPPPTEEEIADAMKSGVPAARFGTANEVANAIAFLCTPAASYINGINVPVDGGRTKSL